MLKYLELRNFESHKHTILRDLSDGFNLIQGASNVGKTSLIRALRLVAHQEFDPKSVRVGESKCEVIVETERGRVSVVRGPKANSWEVTPAGGVTQVFDKVGKQIIPEAARIIGLNIIRLGDTDIPVNIMEQLESHFMLASVGGQDASGSMRAQVIDEISGLSGIEGVIKDVSLDNHRFGREVRETELSMQETCKQLHDANELKQEAEVLGNAEQSLSHREECLKARDDAKTIADGWSKGKEESKGIEDRLAQIPDLEAVQYSLKVSKDALAKLDKVVATRNDVDSVRKKVKVAQSALAGIPDADNALQLSEKARESMDAAVAIRKVIDEYNGVSEKVDATAERIAAIGDTDGAVVLIRESMSHRDRAQSARKFLDEIRVVRSSISRAEGMVKNCETEMAARVAERDALLEDIKVCPITLGPVLPECIEKARKQ